ncbi:MAG: KEOPS complex subunit Cgi121 [Halobacteriota archaeon]|nr:KEOPS complex subunit Cgi121 [Halobacteriota archaeon]
MQNILEGVVEIEELSAFLEGIKRISGEYGVIIQFFDSKKVAGESHLLLAVEKGLASIESGNNISSDPAMEILLYASGKRQINKALAMGVVPGINEVVVIVIGDSEKAILELKKMIVERPVLEYSQSKRESIINFFDITPAEVEVVGEDKIPDLVLERVVMLDMIK